MTKINWICNECAVKLCKNINCNYATTWHYRDCDVCKEYKSVTEPRDFGGLKNSQQGKSTTDGVSHSSTDTQSLSNSIVSINDGLFIPKDNVRLAIQEEGQLINDLYLGKITYSEFHKRRKELFGSKLC